MTFHDAYDLFAAVLIGWSLVKLIIRVIGTTP